MKKVTLIIGIALLGSCTKKPAVVTNSSGGTITTIAGNGTAGSTGDGGPATACQLTPGGVAFDNIGNTYILDGDNHCVRKINLTGIITTIAGNGIPGYSGDGGPATAAELHSPINIWADISGNIYIADFGNNVVRIVNTSGIISTIAGNGTGAATGPVVIDTSYYSGDGGQATDAELTNPAGIATDNSGNIFIADDYNRRIRKVNAAGIISTVAGNGDGTVISGGFSGDGGPATAAALGRATGVAVDNAGNIYIADSKNNRIRMVNTSGIITTIAGNGTAGYSGDGGAATAAELNYPCAIAFDHSGNIFITDAQNNCIRKINASGFISTVAGTGISGYNGDGEAATAAELKGPHGIVFDNAGNLYIADAVNYRVRKVSH